MDWAITRSSLIVVVSRITSYNVCYTKLLRGYFFGKDLHDKLDVPIGLIHTSWGGTVAETWTSPQMIQTDPDFKDPMIELQQLDLANYRKQKEAEIRKLLGGEIPTEVV